MDLAARIDRLEAEADIRQLVARYNVAVAEHDLEGTLGLFTQDAVLGIADGSLGASGMAELRAYFLKRFAVTEVCIHVTHEPAMWHVSPDEATGQVTAHSELWRDGEMIVTAFRYSDTYRRTVDGWRFSNRLVTYLYYVPPSLYDGVLGRNERVLTNRAREMGDGTT